MYDLQLKKIKREEEIEQTIEILKNGSETQFWKFIVEVLDENIKTMVNELVSNEKLSPEDNLTLKRLIRVLYRLKTFPEEQISYLRAREFHLKENYDPYF